MKKGLLFILSMLWLIGGAIAQSKTVTGTVTNQDGETIPGVNIIVKSTSTGTVTDINGIYSILVPDGGILVFSFIGFATQEVEVGNRSKIDVTMLSDVKQLSEIVVVGYGTQERKTITGAVSTVSSKEIETLVTPSFDAQLSGRAAGVQVTTPGGILGQRSIIRIRGVNSLTSSADPLIVIDGVPLVDSDRSSWIDSNPLGNLNPADIESFEVLKDGSATAIYGSRAANGVLLITTKRGEKGSKLKVNYNGIVGFNEEVNRFDLLNADQFVTIANEKRTNAGASALANDGGVESDWQDYVFRKGAVNQHNISLSGGSELTNYFFSMGYMDQESAVLANDMQRYSFRANVDGRIAKSIRLGSSLSYAWTQINGLNNGQNSLSGVVYNAARMLPNVPILDPENAAFDGFNVQPDGTTLGWGVNNAGPDNNIPNIAFVLANNQYRNRTHRILGNVYGEVEVITGLTLRTQFGADLTMAEDWVSWDLRHGDGRGRGGYANQTYNPVYRWNWQNVLVFNRKFNDHNINLTAGTEYQKTIFYNFNATGQNFSDRYYQQNNLISGSYGVQTIDGGYFPQGFDSYFGRLNYDFKGKYLLSLTVRNDGISDLASENRRGFFPGGSIGWRISDESFFNSNLIKDLKLRASYAEVGNTEIGILAYAGGFSPVLYGPNAGIAFTRVTNNNLQWETSKKLNIGLNTTIGRFTIEADYFNTNVDNLVLEAPVDPSLGVPPTNKISRNIGSMTNSGFEFRAFGRILSSGKFSWNSDVNFTYITNEVTDLIAPLPSSPLTNRTEVGQSIAELYGYKWAGVNSQNGNPMYYKADNSIVQYNLSTTAAQRGWRVFNPENPGDVSQTSSLGSADLRYLGNTLPKWFGGWTNSFGYGSFDLEIFTRYSGGNFIMNETQRGMMGMGFSNNHVDILNRWTESGQVTDVPKLFSGQDANIWQTGAANSRFVEKGDFVRIQNIVLGYRVPKTILDNIFQGNVQNVRAFAQVQNPFIFTSYSGLDPELNRFANQLQFGVDFNNAPIIRTYSLGLNVEF